MIICELLSFVTHYINNSTIDNIKKIMTNFYSSEEVEQGKKLLWEIENANLGKYQERNSTNKRSSKDANIDDIFKALKLLDERDTKYVFVAHDLKRLPNIDPEELNSVFLLERVSNFERKLREYDDILSNQRADILRIQDKIDISSEDPLNVSNEPKSDLSNSNRSQNYEQIIKYDIGINNIENNTHIERRHNSDGAMILKNKPSESVPNFTNLPKKLEDTNKLNKSKLSTSETLKSIGQSDKFLKTRWINNTGFKDKGYSFSSKSFNNDTFVNGNRFDSRKFNFGNSFGRRSFNSDFDSYYNGNDKLKDIFLYKVSDTNADEIVDYCRRYGVKVNDIKLLSHPQARYLSYRISIPSNKLSLVLNRDFWPLGAGVKTFRYIR